MAKREIGNKPELADELSRERLKNADERLRWQIERSNLMRVIFQLSAALEWSKHHD
jgi:hypothetical protein